MIASSTGVNPEELSDDTQFSALGPDPILSKPIVDRISDTTGMKLNPAVFHTTCPTIGSLKHHLATPVQSPSPSARIDGDSNGPSVKTLGSSTGGQ